MIRLVLVVVLLLIAVAALCMVVSGAEGLLPWWGRGLLALAALGCVGVVMRVRG